MSDLSISSRDEQVRPAGLVHAGLKTPLQPTLFEAGERKPV